MNSILETEPNLPPGLWLPTAEEDTTQYLRENFVHRMRDEDAVFDYGSFVVALAVLGAQETGRVSMMITRNDLIEMHDAGYGLSERMLHKCHGGIRKLNTRLGFHADGYVPERGELLKRFMWAADYGFETSTGKRQPDNIEEVIRWGAARDLTPSFNRVYKILEGDTTELRQMFDVERRDHHSRYTPMDFYKFGAKVLREHDRPLTAEEIDELYPDEFVSGTFDTIRRAFGTYGAFWLEFDCIANGIKLSKETVLNKGVQWAIQNGWQNLTQARINQLSSEKRFPSRVPIRKFFGGVPAFREEVKKGFEEYIALSTDLQRKSVASGVCKAVLKRFEVGPEYAKKINSNLRVLLKLTNNPEYAKVILNVIGNGFNIDEELFYEIQQEDFKKCLRKVGITSEAEKRFIFELIPRLDPDEALATL